MVYVLRFFCLLSKKEKLFSLFEELLFFLFNYEKIILGFSLSSLFVFFISPLSVYLKHEEKINRYKGSKYVPMNKLLCNKQTIKRCSQSSNKPTTKQSQQLNAAIIIWRCLPLFLLVSFLALPSCCQMLSFCSTFLWGVWWLAVHVSITWVQWTTGAEEVVIQPHYLHHYVHANDHQNNINWTMIQIQTEVEIEIPTKVQILREGWL